MSIVENKSVRPKLGRGLAALLGEDGSDHVSEGSANNKATRSLPVASLQPGVGQPRRHFNEEALDALAQSIRERGMLQPIIARRLSAELPGYEIIAGERRWRAAQRAGLAEVPVILRDMTDRDALEIALIENIQREDLNPIEEANGYQNLVDSFGYTQEDLAKAVGKSRPHVANMMRLLNLPATLRTYVAEGRLSAGHARALLVAKDPEKLAELVVQRGLNVRQTERLVQEGGMQAPRKPSSRDPNVVSAEKDLSDALGLKAALQPVGKRGGRLVLHYKDYDQLEFLISRLTKRPHQYT